ncbi:hypothetical protein HD806DRAFT_399799 [Xylariaceae sp. AK1471]|nr:hypothetical protein HD806DRAFT_399799 [Xylariaceae sp. AK1471]
MATIPRSHNDYTVGWVCALPKEQTAATAMLDQRHAPLPKSPKDHNTYTLGSIGNHNIVIACLPKGKIGTNSAATVATQMVNAFPSIKFGLMVGIGGGMPPKVRLGDVVVSTPTDQYPGVVQWDIGKAENGDKFKRIGALNNPPALLLTAVSTIETEHELNGPKIPEYLEELAAKYPRLAPKYLRSSSLKDVLFKANNDHRNDNGGHTTLDHADICSEEEEEEEEDCCRYCDKTQVVRRKPRDMRVHYGLIASGNQVIKNATFRDKLRQDLGSDVLCVEMEAAGLMDSFPCIVIRGICDYADSHKNKGWQEHAAAVAAAFAKELLGCIQPSEVDQERAAKDILTGISNNLSCIQANVTHTRSYLDKKEDLEILDWLTPTDYGPQQSDNFNRRQPGTGQWMLDSVEYQDWIKEPKMTLFCQGMPGAGKTILTSILVNDLENRFYRDNTTTVAYIYCYFKRQNEQTSKSLLSSLLKQLARSQSSLPASVKELYDRHNAKRTRPSLDEVSRVLQLVAAQYSRVFIVVDALDECQALDGCRTSFLDEIFSLQAKAGVSILATSRFIPEITERFEGATSIEIRASEGDIRGYLRGRLSELPKFVTNRSDLQDEITATVANAVDGMFLLAQLHFASLIGKDTPKALRDTLQKLSTGPNDYNTAYENAMKRIEGQIQGQAKRAKQVLSWITCVKRPLTKLELQHALAVEINKPQLDKDNLPQVEDVVSVCAGLVTIDQKNSVVRLVHYTTQDYFERTQGIWFPHAELSITNTCTTYLSYRDFASGHVETGEELRERLRLYPLYDYAAHNWGHHARVIPTYQENVLSFLLKISQVEASFQGLLEGYGSFREAYSEKTLGGTTGLHLAAYFGLDEAMKLLIDKHNTDVRDKYDETPLSWAASNGHAAAVNVLLSTQGVNPDSKNEYGQTPLYQAAGHGHETVVKLLLSTKGVDPDSKDDNGWTPLLRSRIWA